MSVCVCVCVPDLGKETSYLIGYNLLLFVIELGHSNASLESVTQGVGMPSKQPSFWFFRYHPEVLFTKLTLDICSLQLSKIWVTLRFNFFPQVTSD